MNAPQNLDAERGILGAIIRDPSIVTEAMPKIDNPDFFYFDAHQHIFRAMIDLYTTHRGIDIVTLIEQVKRRGNLEDVGGASYIVELLDKAPTAANWREHVGIIREIWAARRTQQIAIQVLQDIGRGASSIGVLDQAQRAFSDVVNVAGGLEERPLRWPAPLYASELNDDGPDIEYLLDGFIARGFLTLFLALMKCGKSTWLGHLLRALQDGREFMGRRTSQCRTLIVSEETERTWRKRRNVLGLDDHLSIMCKPTMAKLTFIEWLDFVDEIGTHAEQRNKDLVIFDTTAAFAPWKDENNNAEIMQAITPLNRLTKGGLAVMLVHHSGKLDQSQGRASRGGSALPGAADVILEMRRYDGDDINDRRRVFTCFGRLEDEPSEVVVELASDGSGYHACGSKRETEANELFQRIDEILPAGGPGIDAEQVHDALPFDAKPSRSKVGKALKDGASQGRWNVSGTGKRGDKQLFWKQEK